MVKDGYVFFINPPSKKKRMLIRNFDCATESKGNYLYQPYDFLILSSHFPKNMIKLIDAIESNFDLTMVLNKVEHPKLFIVSMADTNWDEDYEFIKTLKDSYPTTPLFVFGDSFMDSESVDSVRGIANGVLSNPIDCSFNDISMNNNDKWFSGPGFFNKNDQPSKALKQSRQISIGEQKHSLFLLPKYRWPFSKHKKYTTVFTAWGCPYSCSYCIVSNFPNLFRTHQEVINELLSIKEIGIKEIYIGDRSFGLPKSNSISLLEEMIRLKLNLDWSTYFHPNQYEENLLELMKKSGCHTIVIGIESHNLDSLKTFGRHTKLEQIKKLIAHAKRLKIHVCGDFMIGLPGESETDILKTIDFSLDLNIDYASFNIAAPLPGTSLKKEAIADGRIKTGEEKHYDTFGYSKVLSNGVLTSEKITKLRNLAVKKFYLRPKYLLKSLTRISSLEHLTIQIQEMIQIILKLR